MVSRYNRYKNDKVYALTGINIIYYSKYLIQPRSELRITYPFILLDACRVFTYAGIMVIASLIKLVA